MDKQELYGVLQTEACLTEIGVAALISAPKWVRRFDRQERTLLLLHDAV